MSFKSFSALSASLMTCALLLTSCLEVPTEDTTDDGTGNGVSDGTGDGISDGTVTGIDSIIGIYDVSSDEGVDGIDEAYFGIDSNGNMSWYDYQDDSYDLGTNCYYIDSNVDQLTHISGNTFSSSYSETVTITVNEKGALTLAFSEFPDEDLTLGEKTVLLSSDFLAAECAEVTGTAPVLPTLTGLASIVGIYGVSSDEGIDGVDEGYFGIDSHGNTSWYDYQGDSYDLGASCFAIDSNYDQFTHISGNTFSSPLAGTTTVTQNEGGSLTLVSSEYPEEYSTLGKTVFLRSDFLASECASPDAIGEPPVTGLSSIVGIYGVSSNEGVDGIDEGYLGIDSNGNISWYDYQSDSYASDASCYAIDSNYDQFTHISGNTFSSHLAGTTTATRNEGGGLTLVSSDYPDEEYNTFAKTVLERSDFLSDECATIGTVTDLASIVGIYDWSLDFGVDGFDEYYVGIDSEGYITDYDYQGDTYDSGANCYNIDSNYDQLTHVSGNAFSSLMLGDVNITGNEGGGITLFISGSPEYDIILGQKTSLFHSDFLAAECL